ncbi:CGNR zinc finger domain-containing protein [Pseudorhodoplanes sp.]|uniref:CGNR zinc finger domain-containing protein n=1 Tax=Pseudorhodoplanes sp. TaxID=1934341 RepID=UPI003D0E39A9
MLVLQYQNFKKRERRSGVRSVSRKKLRTNTYRLVHRAQALVSHIEADSEWRCSGTLNQAASHPLAVPQLNALSATTSFISEDPFQTALATIVRDAIDLFGNPIRGHIKNCEQPDCRMLFLDTSRSSRRRWCSMDGCGSRAKGAAFRSRSRKNPHEQ